MKIGIYFLLKDGKIVYIGQTHELLKRVKWHMNQEMDFKDIRFIECNEDKLTFYETRWIKKFKPIFNGTHIKPRRVRKYEKAGRPKGSTKPVKYPFMHFRKLTEKSIIGFGNYKDWTVKGMIERHKEMQLISIYFQMSHITFFDDILAILKITPEWQIEKPGVNKERYHEFRNLVWPERAQEGREMYERIIKQRANQKLKILNAVSRDKQYNKTRSQNQ